jgi:hypothetical protein
MQLFFLFFFLQSRGRFSLKYAGGNAQLQQEYLIVYNMSESMYQYIQFAALTLLALRWEIYMYLISSHEYIHPFSL